MVHRTSRNGYACVKKLEPFEAILYDFDIDGHSLKHGHKRFLDELVVPVVQIDQANTKKKWNIVVEGRTSRSGTDQHNGPLSERRANAVLNYILSHVPKEFVVKAIGKGEIPAANAGEKDGSEDMFYRGVSIQIWSTEQPPPPVRPPVHKVDPPKPKLPAPNKPYQIRMLSAVTANYQLPGGGIQKVLQAGLSKDLMMFEILDVEDKVSYVYVLDAMGTSVGPSLNFKNLGGTKTFKGGWTDFTAPRWLAANDFGGPAVVESASVTYGANSKGATVISFRPLHWYSPGPGFRVSLDTGRTVGSPGIGVASTMGELKLIGKGGGATE